MLKRIELEPGLHRESTRYAARGKWYDSGNMRFRGGYAETIGGWTVLPGTLDGIIRDMFTWTDYSSAQLLAVGTDWKSYIVSGGIPYDLTAIRKTTTGLDSAKFSTGHNPIGSGGEAIAGEFIIVNDLQHGVGLNDFVLFSDMTNGTPANWNSGSSPAVNIRDILNGSEKQVVHVLNENVYWLVAGETVDDGTAFGGESAKVEYLVNSGLSTQTSGTGWGASVWGGVPVVFSIATISIGAVCDITVDPGANFFPDGELILIEGIGAGQVADLLNGNYFTVTGGNLASLTFNLLDSTGALVDTTGLTGPNTGGTATGGEGWNDPATVEVLTGDIRSVYIDNYNEDLIVLNSGGPLFYWDTSEKSDRGVPKAGSENRFQEFSTVIGQKESPSKCGSFLVSDRDGHVVAFACNDLGLDEQNNLLVRWSDQNNPFDWDSTDSTNTSGGQMLRVGSKIIGAVNTKSEVIIFTDLGVYSMRFVGPPDTFGFSIVSEGVELASGRAAIDVANVVYFMGPDKFYAYTGVVSPIVCPIEKDIFQSLNREFKGKIFSGLNYEFGEVMWFYPEKGSAEPTSYVAFNYLENTWYSGRFDMSEFSDFGASSNTYNRTSWLDSKTRSESLSGYIKQVDYDSLPSVKKSGIMIHESGQSGQGQPIESFLESGFFEVGSGDNMAHVSRIVPDIEFFGYGSDSADPSVTVTLLGSDRPGGAVSTLATQTVTGNLSAGTVAPVGGENAVRARSREMYIRMESSTISSGWRMGDFSLEAKPDGRR